MLNNLRDKAEAFFEQADRKRLALLAGGAAAVLIVIVIAASGGGERREVSPFFSPEKNEIPADFLNPIPQKAVEILPPPIEEAPPAVEKPLVPERLFNFVQPPKLTKTEEDMLRDKINEQRRGAAPFKAISVKDYLFYAPPTEPGIKVIADPNTDKDFSEHEEPRTTATYPVDLSRVITMDRMIPAVMITEVRSDLASEKVLAMVESDVVGTHGRKILVPAGSRVIGRYAATGEIGEARLMIQWYRIITPAGINIKLTAEAADQEGAAGLTGLVDNRWNDRYGAAMLFATISAVAQMTVPADNDNAKAAADAFSQNLGEVTAEAIRRGFDVAPRIRISKGARVFLSPLQDVWFKEPAPGAVDTEATPIQL